MEHIEMTDRELAVVIEAARIAEVDLNFAYTEQGLQDMQDFLQEMYQREESGGREASLFAYGCWLGEYIIRRYPELQGYWKKVDFGHPDLPRMAALVMQRGDRELVCNCIGRIFKVMRDPQGNNLLAFVASVGLMFQLTATIEKPSEKPSSGEFDWVM